MISWANIRRFVLDVLFPVHCLSCDHEGAWLCDRCAGLLQLHTGQSCPVCRAKTAGSVCASCRSQTALDGLIVAADYDQAIIQKLIHTLKYLSIPDVANTVAGFMWQCVRQISDGRTPTVFQGKQTVLMPVPLHSRRLRQRGFNQSERISLEISRLSGLETALFLRRTRHTTSQMTLSRAARLKNVVNAFRVNSGFKNMPKNVILIDDVATTLATLHECARVLKSHGVSTVWGFVAARGSS